MVARCSNLLRLLGRGSPLLAMIDLNQRAGPRGPDKHLLRRFTHPLWSAGPRSMRHRGREMSDVRLDAKVARAIARVIRLDDVDLPMLRVFHGVLADILMTASEADEAPADGQIRRAIRAQPRLRGWDFQRFDQFRGQGWPSGNSRRQADKLSLVKGDRVPCLILVGVLLTCPASVAHADALMTPNEALSPTMASDLRDARPCERQDRDLCANREVECHRDCTNLTTCGRTCCELY